MRAILVMFLLAANGLPQTYLFVDDAVVARKTGVRRELHPAHRLNRPVIQADQPWEESRVYVYGTVVHDLTSHLFRMWYMSIPGTSYATSADGLHWNKPELDIVPLSEFPRNNLVSTAQSASVILDPDDSERPYKMACIQRQNGKMAYWTAWSHDGLHWQFTQDTPVINSADTITLSRNPATREYLIFHKWMATVRGFSRRTIWLSRSRDFKTWSKPEMVLAPDEQDDRWTTLPRQRTEFYVMSAFPYANRYLGMLSIFRVEREAKARDNGKVSPLDGPMEIQLTHSADGVHWQRFEDRTPIVGRGPPGAFDAGCIMGVANAPVEVGDELWLYYTGITTGHGGAPPEKRIAIGRAAWRKDGFVSLTADGTEGVVETVPLSAGHAKLTVNAEAAGGSLTAELLDQNGNVIPGFDGRNCLALHSDAVRQAVRWKKAEVLPANAGRIRFHLQKARLYSLMLSR